MAIRDNTPTSAACSDCRRTTEHGVTVYRVHMLTDPPGHVTYLCDDAAECQRLTRERHAALAEMTR